jgi:hypothetical protein
MTWSVGARRDRRVGFRTPTALAVAAAPRSLRLGYFWYLGNPQALTAPKRGRGRFVISAEQFKQMTEARGAYAERG